MEKDITIYQEEKTGVINEVVKELPLKWPENITVLDLSNKQIINFDENVMLPPKLMELNISHNCFVEIPSAVLCLSNLKCLDVSHNRILYFDDTPKFSDTIEDLNIASNALAGPPYWIWAESPAKLAKLNLSNNIKLTQSLEDDITYTEDLLQNRTLVTEVIIYNCRIRNHLQLLGVFNKAKRMEIGTPDLSTYSCNHVIEFPCVGVNQCCDIERLDLSNTQIYNIEHNIDIYKNLTEINLSYNNLDSLPNSFCNLENLEICVLSFNRILYLPVDMIKLKKLSCLRLDSNELCMIPENLCSLPDLRILDLYDNSLYEVPDDILDLEELDLAQNYLLEPDSAEYLKKKEKLRLNTTNRHDERKVEVIKSESEQSEDTTDDEELIEYMNNQANIEPPDQIEPASSPEDWDSEDYWVPCYFKPNRPSQSPWLHFVKRKMAEGNFCPMDMHTISITEMVRYEKQCNPKHWVPADGQFDDCSEDDS